MTKAAIVYPYTKLSSLASNISKRERDLAIGRASQRVEGLRESAGEGIRDAIAQLAQAEIPPQPEDLDASLLLLDRVSTLAALFEVAHVKSLADDLANLWMADESDAPISAASEIYLKAMKLLASVEADEDEIAKVLAEIARLRLHLNVAAPSGN